MHGKFSIDRTSKPLSLFLSFLPNMCVGSSVEEMGGTEGGNGEGGLNSISQSQWESDSDQEKGLLFLSEAKRLAWIGGPMIVVSVFLYSLQLISVMFLGHLGELALSSASLATSLSTVTGTSFLMGMGCALDTFCGQAYGAKQYHLLGIFLQRGIVVLSLTGIPLAFLWANIGKLLLLIGQDPDISVHAGEYATWLIPTLFAYAFSQPLIKFLLAQSLVFPLVFCSLLVAAFHVPFCWFMIIFLNLGAKGAALATSLSNWFGALMLLSYVFFSKSCEKTRCAPTLEALHNLKSFFRLAIPSAGMICLEWWSYEALVIISGLLPNPELQTSTLSICLVTTSWVFMIPAGLGSAASTRVSNELGAGHPRMAQLAFHTAVAIGFIESLIVATICLLLRNQLGRAYSNTEEVINYVAQITPWLVAQISLDGIQGVLSGIVRGCGWQKAGAFVNLFSYYVVGLPLAVYFAFVLHYDSQGLWMGAVFGSCFQLLGLILITFITNWEKEAENAAARLSSSRCLIEPLLAQEIIRDVEGTNHHHLIIHPVS